MKASLDMPGAVPPSNETPPAAPSYAGVELRPSAYDRAASLLATLLIIFGFATLLMLLVWLTGQMFQSNIAVPVEFEEIGDGGLGDNQEFDPDVEIPGVEMEFEQPDLLETLTTITDALATNPAMLEDPALWDTQNQGTGGPAGDGRAPGDGTGRPGKPRKWAVRFPEGNTVESYAEQLDYFGIEIGVLDSGNKLTYVYNLSAEHPSSHIGQADAEERYHLIWQSGTLQQADRELLSRAGVGRGRLIVELIPQGLEERLYQMEQVAAGDRRDKLKKTYFEVYESDGIYDFRVFDQDFGL